MFIFKKISEFLKTLKREDKTYFEKMVEKWNDADGDKKLRLNYNLDEHSIIFDVGGYEGQWASDIFSKYQPTIYIFEPVKAFAENISKRFEKNKKIIVHNFGLSDKNENVFISVENNQSSIFKIGHKKEKVKMVCINDFITQNKIENIDLIKINIEGGEYSLLECLISTRMITHIRNIQVQFHSFVSDANIRMSSIQRSLKKTHSPTYSFPFVWENWEKNE